MRKKNLEYTNDESVRDWTAGKEPKRAADQLLIGAMVPDLTKIKNRPIAALTFPGGQCVFEQNLAKALPNHKVIVSAVECHEPTYEALLAITASLAFKQKNLEVSLRFGTSTLKQAIYREFRTWADDGDPRQFDVLFPDFDGTYGEAKVEALQRALRWGALAPGGFLITTMSLPRGRTAGLEALTDFSDEGKRLSGPVLDMRQSKHGFSDFGHAKVYGYVGLMTQKAMEVGIKLRHIQTPIYDSFLGGSPGSLPQIYHLFQRVAA